MSNKHCDNKDGYERRYVKITTADATPPTTASVV